MGSLSRKAAVVGIHEFPLRIAPGYTNMRIEAESAKAALDDAGLKLGDVDAYFGVTAPVESGSGITMCDYLNIHPKIVGDTNIGGATFVYNVLEAAALIAAGYCDVALVTYAQVSASRGVAIGTGMSRAGGQPRIGRAPWWTEAWHSPYGLIGVADYAQVAQRHMYDYGTTSEQLAEIAVATRYHASMNPQAKYQAPISVQDVVNSRMICSPLHLLDCCVITDGGGAFVVVSPEVARDCKRPPAWFLGGAMAVEHRSAGYRDYSKIAAARSGPPAFADAGVAHKDIDVCMLYDSYTITVLTTLEGLGFCGFGEGGSFVQGGRLRLGGELPLNTDGGGLSSNHPGARGLFLVIEATRQLRGNEGQRQVKDCKIALCHGTGGNLGTQHSGATIVLARD